MIAFYSYVYPMGVLVSTKLCVLQDNKGLVKFYNNVTSMESLNGRLPQRNPKVL